MLRGFLGAFCAAFLMFNAAQAQAQETPVRAAAARLSAALAGDAAAREALVRDHFTTQMSEGARGEDWRRVLETAADQSGGFEIVAAEPGESERFGEFIIRTREGERFAWLVLGVSRTDLSRISTLMFMPAGDPAHARALPERAVPAREIAQAIAARVEAMARSDEFSGAVLVARSGRVLAEAYVGFADRAAGRRVTNDTIFNIASMGKMFTALAIGRLVQEGVLSWEDPVSRWVPDYPEALGRQITIAQLLSHTSGLGDIFTPAYRAAPQNFISAPSYLPLIAEPPAFEPGARFAYSNAGYSLLGIIIERATGEDYFAYVKRSVFDRAGMGATGFARLDQANAQRATGYRWLESDPFGAGQRGTNEEVIALTGNAAGGAYATARDMLAFARALQSGRLVSAETRAVLQEPREQMRPNARYGYGFITRTCAGRAFIGHGGGGARAGVNSNLLMSEDGEWVIVTLSNYDPAPRDLADELCDFVARQ